MNITGDNRLLYDGIQEEYRPLLDNAGKKETYQTRGTFTTAQDPTIAQQTGQLGNRKITTSSPPSLRPIDPKDLIHDDESLPITSEHTITEVTPQVPSLPIEQEKLIEAYQAVNEKRSTVMESLREIKHALSLVTERDQEIITSLKPFVMDSEEWASIFSHNTMALLDQKLIPNSQNIPILVKDTDGNCSKVVPPVIPSQLKTIIKDENNVQKVFQDKTKLATIPPETRKKLKQELQQALEHCYAEVPDPRSNENSNENDNNNGESENQNLVKIRNFFACFDKDKDFISVKEIANLLEGVEEIGKNLNPSLHEALDKALQYKESFVKKGSGSISDEETEAFRRVCTLSQDETEASFHQFNENLQTIWNELPSVQKEFLTALYHRANAVARQTAVVGTTVAVGGAKLSVIPLVGAAAFLALTSNPVTGAVVLVAAQLLSVEVIGIQLGDEPPWLPRESKLIKYTPGYAIGLVTGAAISLTSIISVTGPAGLVLAIPLTMVASMLGGTIHECGDKAGQAVSRYLQVDASSEQAQKSFAEFSEAFNRSCGNHLEGFLTTTKLLQENNRKQLEQVNGFLKPDPLRSRNPILQAVAKKFKTYLESKNEFYQNFIVALEKQIQVREENKQKEGERIDSKVYLRRGLL